MIVDDLIARLDGVRRSTNGWMARCPAHDDKHPSLSISEGDKGLLIHCFSGCAAQDVCTALGINMRDLFYEHHQLFDVQVHRQRSGEQGLWQKRAKATLLINVRRIDEYRHAELIIQALTGVDINGWTAEQLDEAMNMACDAHVALLEEGNTYKEQSNVVGF